MLEGVEIYPQPLGVVSPNFATATGVKENLFTFGGLYQCGKTPSGFEAIFSQIVEDNGNSHPKPLGGLNLVSF